MKPTTLEQKTTPNADNSKKSVGFCSKVTARAPGGPRRATTFPTFAYNVGTATTTPSSVRFEPRVLERLTAFVAVHRDMSLSSASNRLVDEALRMHEHPLIVFKDGPAGRRARLVGGPDVWEVIGAVRSVRESDLALAGDEVLEVVAETSGVPMPFLRAALAYWGDYPEEVDAFLDRARAEAAQARAGWERQQELLGR